MPTSDNRSPAILHPQSFTRNLSGTVCLFFPGYDTLSAMLYIIGSLGFLAVDVQVGGRAGGRDLFEGEYRMGPHADTPCRAEALGRARWACSPVTRSGFEAGRICCREGEEAETACRRGKAPTNLGSAAVGCRIAGEGGSKEAVRPYVLGREAEAVTPCTCRAR